MAKIYYVGDWAVQCGPVYAESPFNYAHKGLETINYGKWLKAALESDGANTVNSVPTWDFYMLGPGEYEKILDEYDVLIFSDVEAKNFQLAPNFFNHRLFGTKILTFPDRIRLTVEAVKGGKGLMLLGGWLSFSGEMGKGGWNRTGLKELLPVSCLDHEDLVESTEGFTAQAVKTQDSNPLDKIEMGSFPPILGYNKTLPRPEGTVLLEVSQTGDPLLAVRDFGEGKVLAYMSDPAPHWGCNFVFWEHYNDFWLACLGLISR
ncbi:MAG: hypothetical protein FVQ81_15975 [Candidatus Glassbacteria bacterium]|nr:hypothetical protein [Candidatus Glassbacteria bacterium]